MSTQAQIDANRRNAQKSTGPRSVEGKAISSNNAFKTGIHTKRELIRGENAEDLQTLTDLYYQRWSPTTPEQAYLVDVLISTDWITRRLRRCESELWEHHMDEAWTPDKKHPVGQAFQRATSVFDSLSRRLDSTVRTNRKALETLLKLKAAEAPPEPAPEPEPRIPEPPSLLPAEPQQNQSNSPKIGFVLPKPIEAQDRSKSKTHFAADALILFSRR